MPFDVIPALDVSEGRLVRIGTAGPLPVDAFGGEPLAAAEAFVEAGARWLHLVDVDMAERGDAGALEILSAVAKLGVPVQASGGVTSGAQVSALLEAGASRVVLGSGALGYRSATEQLLGMLGQDVVIGIEADGPTIRPRGQGGELPLWDTLLWLGGLDVPRYLFTEVGRVGSLEGPDLDGIWALATHTGKPVVASGGVRGLEDLQAVAGLGEPVEAAIVGRALYDGLDLRRALLARSG